MIDQAKYEVLRREFRESGQITADLYRILARLTRAVVFGGNLPPAYSPSGHWDAESLNDALHSWIERRLLRTNALLAAFDLGEAPRPFLSSLERNFRHYLENVRERGELGNLIGRTNAILREDEEFRAFIERRRTSETWWGLSSWHEAEAFQGGDPELVSHAWALGEIPLFLYSRNVERASPILSTANLRRLLTGLFERVEAMLTISHFAAVYRFRFDLGPPREVDLDHELAEQVVEELDAESDQVAETAVALLAELTPRQVEALLLRAQEKTLEEIAERLEVSRGTADNVLRSTGPLIDKHCVDGVTRELILEKVLDALS